MVNIIKDADLIDKISDYEYIIIPNNCYNLFPDGFPRVLAYKKPYIRTEEMKTLYGDFNKVGTVFEIHKENEPTFLVAYISKGYNFRPDLNEVFVSYDAIRDCLSYINKHYKNRKIAMTIIGASPYDGNGDKVTILNIINEICVNIDVDIYDYEQPKLSTVKGMEFGKFVKECHSKNMTYYEGRKAIGKEPRSRKTKKRMYF